MKVWDKLLSALVRIEVCLGVESCANLSLSQATSADSRLMYSSVTREADQQFRKALA